MVKCLRWHPDKNQGTREKQAQALIMFKAISEAHRVLSDAAKRAEYDAEHHALHKRARQSVDTADPFPPAPRSFARESSPTMTRRQQHAANVAHDE